MRYILAPNKESFPPVGKVRTPRSVMLSDGAIKHQSCVVSSSNLVSATWQPDVNGASPIIIGEPYVMNAAKVTPLVAVDLSTGDRYVMTGGAWTKVNQTIEEVLNKMPEFNHNGLPSPVV